MYLKYVKHFLTEAGVAQFPAWLARTRKLLEKHNGFISVGFKLDEQQADLVHFFIIFDSRCNLAAWGKSCEHEAVLEELDPHRSAPWQALLVEL